MGETLERRPLDENTKQFLEQAAAPPFDFHKLSAKAAGDERLKRSINNAVLRPETVRKRASHQRCLKPALKLRSSSPVAVSLTAPVMLNGPPNSRCSALSDGRQPPSSVEVEAPIDTVVLAGRNVKRTA